MASAKQKFPDSLGIPADPDLPLALPRTASDTERIEASFAGVAIHGRFGGTAVVCTANRASFEAIGDMLEQCGMTTQWHRALDASPPLQGDVLICDVNADIVHRLVPAGPESQMPPTLADTGAFADLQTLQPHEGIVPYEINVPFWSDGAIKKRWFSIPDASAKIRGLDDSPYRGDLTQCMDELWLEEEA